MQRILIALFGASVVMAGCVSNPAKHPTPNNDEITFKIDSNDVELKRGTEELDEQDYYELLDDKPAAEEIAAYRASGVRMQAIGRIVGVIGIGIVAATAVAYGLSNQGQIGAIPDWVNYAGYGGGLAVALIGYKVLSNGKARVLKRPVLRAERAETAYNMKRFGTATLGPQTVKAIVFGEGVTTYCGNGGIALTPQLMAKDGNAIKLDGHDDWLQWTTQPEGLFEAGHLKSPWRASLAAFATVVKLTVAVKDSSVATTLMLAPDLGCTEGLGTIGSSGDSGNQGDYGRNLGARGADGTAGTAGHDAGDVEVEAAFVNAPGHDHLLLVVSKTGDDDDIELALVDPSKGSITVHAVGGHGGSGGTGGTGGTGGDRCSDLLVGGNGGTGGTGGSGGRGGRVVIRGSSSAATTAISVDIEGGGGGSAGSAGSGGDGGGNGSCRGTRGSDGTAGAPGTPGTPGSKKSSVVAASELTMIAKVLATNPAITLESGAGGSRKR